MLASRYTIPLLKVNICGRQTNTYSVHNLTIGFPGCGGTFTNNRGEFGSPIQDGVYPRNTLCEFVIRLPNAQSRIKIHFKEFKLESSFECVYDYVKVGFDIYFSV